MLTHSEQRFLPYTPEQMFDLVLDIEKYPEFLPWCVAARITKRTGDALFADVVVGYKMFRETFTSRVAFTRPERVDVEYQKGPMKHLENHWLFHPHNNGCLVNFHVSFEFKSKIFQSVISQFFDKAISKMVNAFEERARNLYA